MSGSQPHVHHKHESRKSSNFGIPHVSEGITISFFDLRKVDGPIDFTCWQNNVWHRTNLGYARKIQEQVVKLLIYFIQGCFISPVFVTHSSQSEHRATNQYSQRDAKSSDHQNTCKHHPISSTNRKTEAWQLTSHINKTTARANKQRETIWAHLQWIFKKLISECHHYSMFWKCYFLN